MRVRIRKADGAWFTLKLISGPKGDRGEKGDPGTGLVLLDTYESLEALNAAHPTGNVGDCYAVGDQAYLWSPTGNCWVLLGQIVGQKGEDGMDGADGVGILSVEQTTASSEDGGANVLTVTLTDGTSTSFTVRNGSRGAQGADGAAPTSFPASGITGVLQPENGGTGYSNLADLAAALGVGSSTAGFVTGTYTGVGAPSNTDWNLISLGFEPKFMLVWNPAGVMWNNYHDTDENGDEYWYSFQMAAFLLPGHPALVDQDSGKNTFAEITSDGFKVRNYKYETSSATRRTVTNAYLNRTGATYCYIAGK